MKRKKKINEQKKNLTLHHCVHYLDIHDDYLFTHGRKKLSVSRVSEGEMSSGLYSSQSIRRKFTQHYK